MISKDYNKKDLIIQLFLVIDDLVKLLPILPWSIKWRKAKLSASETITCMLFWMLTWFKNIKDLYRDLTSYHSDSFLFPCYKNFVESVNKYGRDALLLLSTIIQINRNNSWWRNKFIDSTCVAVCNNKRIFDHKVCKWFAQRWKSTMWWFFWFKIHIIVDDVWNLLSFSITPWNCDDRKVVKKMVRKLTGTLIADAWYISNKLRDDLKSMWITFLTNYKKNMKVLVTQGFHRLMKLRQIVETWFGMMKCWWNLVSSYSRSLNWHFSRIIYNVLGYCIRKLTSNSQLAIS